MRRPTTMRLNVWGSARTGRSRPGRVASAVLAPLLGIALQLTGTPPAVAESGLAGAVAAPTGDEQATPRIEPVLAPDYMAVAALTGEPPTLVGVALARMRGDAQELVLGVCGLRPDHPYRLVIDGMPAANLTPSEHGVINASLSTAPGAAEEALPESVRPVSRLVRVELTDGIGAVVVSGDLKAVRAPSLRHSPRADGATARAQRATATP